MMRSLSGLLSIVLFLSVSEAYGQEPESDTSEVGEPSETEPSDISDLPIQDAQAQPNFQIAAGLSAGWLRREDFGDGSFSRFTPEVIVFGYLPVFDPVFLRPGLRVSYAWQQPEMPKSVRVEENDLAASAELGVLYESYAIPSLTLGVGYISRKIRLVTEKPVVSVNSDISTRDSLYFASVQAGVGIPLWKGFVVAEPYVRYVLAAGDSRLGLGFGVEVTFQIL